MSRLEIGILRLQAQKACLDAAAKLTASIPGSVWELGLGNGRSYDHLRQIFPHRAIYVFDREIAAHPTCIPADNHMILGDLYETLPRALELTGEPAVFIHCDLGSHDTFITKKLSEFVGKTLNNGFLIKGSVIASDQSLDLLIAKQLPLPDYAPKECYFLYSCPL